MKRTKDRIIAGVCGGIAKELGCDPLVIRLLFVAAFLLFGAGPLIYLILWILMPNEA